MGVPSPHAMVTMISVEVFSDVGMATGFEVFDKRMTPLAKAPSVTIQRRGVISLNRVAHDLINNGGDGGTALRPPAEVLGVACHR